MTKMTFENPASQNPNVYANINPRFFLWIGENIRQGFTNLLSSAIEKEGYTDAVWKSLTGKTLEELWKEYQANPALKYKAF